MDRCHREPLHHEIFRVQAAESQPAVVRPAGNKTVAVSSISSSEYVEEQLANLGLCFCFF